jgi:signal transduction histidine kinase
MSVLVAEEMKIRDAVEADLPAIIDIYNAAIATRMSTAQLDPVTVESRRRWLTEHSPDRHPFWVMEIDGQIAGWLTLKSFPGAGRLTIVSRPESSVSSRRSVVVEVTDTGVGMDHDALNKIFEPYFSTKATGTGLGLTIAKRNIELNGGTISVISQRGVGTTVTMILPRGEA